MFLTTLGCRLNEAEIAGLARDFRAAGHTVVGEPENAQLLVVNTCAVTAEAARKSRKLIAGLHRRSPDARVAVTGCYAHLEADKTEAMAGVDLVLDNRDKDRLVEIIDDKLGTGALAGAEPSAAGSRPDPHRRRTRAFVKVQDGCRNRCSYCVVTVARGDERSRPIAEVVEEVGRLCADGYQEAVLTGVHLGGYGHEQGTSLHRLVETLLGETSIPRLRLSSLEPWDLPAEFWALWQHPRLMPHLHLPLQSGCDTVLKRMSRRCTAASYREVVAQARSAIPDLTLTTDVIVGFPGETDEEFAATLGFVQSIGYGHIHVFAFSPRQGTRAAMLPNRVTADLARDRSRRLHEVSAEMRRAHASCFVGQTRSVLWEGRGEPLPDGGIRWLGYTDNYLRVVTRMPAGHDLENHITPALLERAADKPPAQLEARCLPAERSD